MSDPTAADNSLRVGVLGCGPVAQAAHFEACRKAENAELYALCDVADDLRERMAAVHRPRAQYADYDALLADPAVDAVLVATADAFHVPAARKAVAAGKHVLVEKPLGTDLEACIDLRDRVEEAGVVLQVGHMKRFDPGLEFARTFIEERLGDLFAFKAWYADSTHRYDMTDATQPVIVESEQANAPAEDPKADLAHYYMRAHGSHLFDTTRFLGGPLTAVRARQTLDAVLSALPTPPPVALEPELYLAPAGALLERLQALPAEADPVLLVGHNPGLENLVQGLAGRGEPEAAGRLREGLKTATLAVLECPAWPELAPRSAQLTALVRPRDLETD